jgi:N6-adenosine-specific RNA methylase IME4
MPIFGGIGRKDWEMDIITQANNLPTKIEDLSRFVLVGREKMVSVRAEIRAIDKLGLGKEVRQQKLDEGQMIAEALLDAEVRLGELMRDMPKATPNNNPFHENRSDAKLVKQKGEVLKDAGFNKDQTSRFQTLADPNNREIIAQAKVEAREKDSMVSRDFVLEKIKAKQREDLKEIVANSVYPTASIVGEYDVIYADPPWRYDFSETTSRDIENQYPTMAIDDIKAMKVPSASNAVLLLWATAPKLREALDVMSAWGFEYKTCAVWDKVKIGMGYWFRGQHEMLLVGTKGQYSPPPPELRISSVYTEARREHSEKPKHYYDMIETMFPGRSYLELFARKRNNDKWEVWGNQIE